MSRTANTDELYFVTLTVVDWVDVFTRRLYSDFIVQNLAWCQTHKKLNIYAYVIMTNHIHLLANVTDGSLSDVLRDFKTYTSKELVKLISSNPAESRKKWMLGLFERAGKYNPQNVNHQFWQNGNYPVLLYSAAVIDQKIDYIHQNPVRAGFVGSAHEYWYSSANAESPSKRNSLGHKRGRSHLYAVRRGRLTGRGATTQGVLSQIETQHPSRLAQLTTPVTA